MTHVRKIISVSREAFLQACEIKAHDRPAAPRFSGPKHGPITKWLTENGDKADVPQPETQPFNVHKE